MMTSDPHPAPTQLYVWVWLPRQVEPVVAGVLTTTHQVVDREPVITFTYAKSYRTRADAVSLFTPELPLVPGTFDPSSPRVPADALASVVVRDDVATPFQPRTALPLHGCIRDAAPDAWGRRVINLKLARSPDVDLTELTYLAHSSSDRIGALDFQASATEYVARGGAATLEQLLHVTELIETGQSVPDDLLAAAGHGTSIGGARPKAVLTDGGRALIAKFSSTTDTRPVVKAEAVAMLLAARAGMTVAPVETRVVNGKDVLLVERFDRPADGGRRQMLSALTILGLSAHESRYATYADLADSIKAGSWRNAGATLREMYTRLVFNVCVGNTDDHLRNHAAFWDGASLELTPAYDVAPQPRGTSVASHAIGLTRDGARSSQLVTCRQAAASFRISPVEADDIIDHVVNTIREEWDDVCDQARLSAAEAGALWRREFLNDYIFYDNP